MGFRVRAGVPWRDAPVGHGPWGQVHGPYRRWRRSGTRRRIPPPADANDAIIRDLKDAIVRGLSVAPRCAAPVSTRPGPANGATPAFTSPGSRPAPPHPLP
ncbi:hypothetical protein ACWCPT_22505 [Streptomyces sp. NPDC002308]